MEKCAKLARQMMKTYKNKDIYFFVIDTKLVRGAELNVFLMENWKAFC